MGAGSITSRDSNFINKEFHRRDSREHCESNRKTIWGRTWEKNDQKLNHLKSSLNFLRARMCCLKSLNIRLTKWESMACWEVLTRGHFYAWKIAPPKCQSQAHLYMKAYYMSGWKMGVWGKIFRVTSKVCLWKERKKLLSSLLSGSRWKADPLTRKPNVTKLHWPYLLLSYACSPTPEAQSKASAPMVK